MGEIALYEALLDAGASKEKAQAAVDDLPRTQDVASKADIAEVRADLAQGLAELETRITWKIVVVAVAAVAIGVALLKLIL